MIEQHIIYNRAAYNRVIGQHIGQESAEDSSPKGIARGERGRRGPARSYYGWNRNSNTCLYWVKDEFKESIFAFLDVKLNSNKVGRCFCTSSLSASSSLFIYHRKMLQLYLAPDKIELIFNHSLLIGS